MPFRQLGIGGFILLAAMMIPQALSAGPITLSTLANASITPGFFDQDSLNATLSPTTDLTLTSSASGTFTSVSVSSALAVSGSAFVTVRGGSLAMGVDTSSVGTTTIIPPGGGITTSGIGQAGLDLSDGLTVFDGPTSGYLILNFLISGSLSTATSGPTSFANTASAGGTFSANGTPLSLNAHSQNGPSGDTGPVSLTFPASWTVLIPYSSSFANMFLHLESTAITNDACFASSGICTESALGALGNTFVLSHIQILESSGQVVPGAYVLGDSGITYNNSAPTAVPEPASLLVLGIGVIFVGTCRWQQRRNT